MLLWLLTLLLAQSFVWDLEDFQISRDFLQIFCESILLMISADTKSLFLLDFQSGFFQLNLDSDINTDTDPVLLGKFPKSLCENHIKSVKNPITVSGYTAKLKFPDGILGLGSQTSSYLVLNSIQIPIFFKSNSNFFILGQELDEEISKDYELVPGSDKLETLYVFSNIIVCTTCNFLMNYHIGEQVTVKSEEGEESAWITEILDTNVITVDPKIKGKILKSIRVLDNFKRKMISYEVTDNIGQLIFLNGLTEIGDYIVFLGKDNQGVLQSIENQVRKVLFSDNGAMVLDEHFEYMEYDDQKLHAIVIKGPKQPKACPYEIHFSPSHKITTFKSKCTDLSSPDFILTFTVSFPTDNLTLYINLDSDVYLFRILLGIESYIFSYKDYSVKKYSTPHLIDIEDESKLFITIYKSRLYISKEDNLANLVLRYTHSGLSEVKSYSMQTFGEMNVNEIEVSYLEEGMSIVFENLEEIGRNYFENKISVELEEGEECSDLKYRSIANFECGDEYVLESVRNIERCRHEITILSPAFCSEFVREYTFAGPTLMIPQFDE